MTTPADPWFQSLFAERIGGAGYGKGTEIYKFEKIKRAKRAAIAAHPERKLLDFGIGENDEMADPIVREALKREVDKLENRGYADNGIAAFKEAAAGFMKRSFGVTLDPVTEVNHAIGSKPALAMLPACFINPGDVTLMTVPGYPVAGTHTKYYGGEVHNLPLEEKNGFYPDLAGIPRRHPQAGQADGHQLPQQPDRRRRHPRLLSPGDRLRPHQPHRGGARRRPHLADLRRPTAQFPAGGRRPRGRRRDPLDVEGL